MFYLYSTQHLILEQQSGHNTTTNYLGEGSDGNAESGVVR